MKIRALFFLLALSSPLLAADIPKNVILLISDGAGVAHYTAAKYFRGADFNIGRMTLVALSTTTNLSYTNTDKKTEAYAYTVRAYDKAGNESGDSNVLSYQKNSC